MIFNFYYLRYKQSNYMIIRVHPELLRFAVVASGCRGTPKHDLGKSVGSKKMLKNRFENHIYPHRIEKKVIV
jgi:hypothetical protein